MAAPTFHATKSPGCLHSQSQSLSSALSYLTTAASLLQEITCSCWLLLPPWAKWAPLCGPPTLTFCWFLKGKLDHVTLGQSLPLRTFFSFSFIPFLSSFLSMSVCLSSYLSFVSKFRLVFYSFYFSKLKYSYILSTFPFVSQLLPCTPSQIHGLWTPFVCVFLNIYLQSA